MDWRDILFDLTKPPILGGGPGIGVVQGLTREKTTGETASEEYNRRLREGQSRFGAYLGTAVSPITSQLSGIKKFAFEPVDQPAREFTVVDPVAQRQRFIEQRQQEANRAAQQDYNRQMAAFTGGYSPIAERQMQAAQEAWNRALGQVAAEQGTVSGLAGQSGRDFRTTGTNVNIGAQRAMTGAGTLPATGVAGMGGVTGVQAADLAAQAGQVANIQGAASQAALQARAGQMGGLNQLLAGQAAASQQQMAAQQIAREQAMGQLLLREQIAAEQAARAQAMESRAGIEAHQMLVESLTPAWKQEWRTLKKADKERLAREQGITSEQQYLTSKSAETWALSQMSQG